ncbi:MAG: hypothetical protein MRY83_01090, partial [Flavobacteriales bacterium]|nr:hypothetical protein [Flavobacteriales bacterium]
YTDKLQRTIMEDNEGAKTYYIYNNFGQLHCVLPPLLSNKLETDNAFTYLTPQNRIGAYLYSYDKWGRTISKDLPGANPTQLYYDRIDRLVMTKDGNGNKVITKYDRIGRPVITGLYTGNAIPSDAMGLFETASSSTFGYSLTNSFPSSGVEVLTVNYYDHYDLDRNGQVTSDEGYKTPLASQFPSSNFDLVKGKTVATLTGVLPSDGSAITDYLLGQVFYDKRGRTIQEKKDNHLSEKTVCYFEYNFPGWLISSRKDHRAVTGSVTHSYVIDKRFTYDHYGRKLSTFQSINGSPEVHLSKERYNERDFLIERKLGLNASGSKFLQDVDYRYDMRGWLTDINNINTSSGPSVPGGSTGGSSIGIGIGE